MFGTKVAFCMYFSSAKFHVKKKLRPKMSYQGTFRQELEKPLPYLKSAHSSVSKYQVFMQNQKRFNLGPKMSQLGIFELQY